MPSCSPTASPFSSRKNNAPGKRLRRRRSVLARLCAWSRGRTKRQKWRPTGWSTKCSLTNKLWRSTSKTANSRNKRRLKSSRQFSCTAKRRQRRQRWRRCTTNSATSRTCSSWQRRTRWARSRCASRNRLLSRRSMRRERDASKKHAFKFRDKLRKSNGWFRLRSRKWWEWSCWKWNWLKSYRTPRPSRSRPTWT